MNTYAHTHISRYREIDLAVDAVLHEVEVPRGLVAKAGSVTTAVYHGKATRS